MAVIRSRSGKGCLNCQKRFKYNILDRFLVARKAHFRRARGASGAKMFEKRTMRDFLFSILAIPVFT
jgi:hypothetical protein